MNDESYNSLMKKAGALLARRAYSRGELRDRLSRMAGDPPLNAVLDRLEQLNLLNDSLYAYNFALRRLTENGWSPDKVQRCLLRRKIAAMTVEQVLERIRGEIGNEPGLEQCIAEYGKRRGRPADLRSLRRLYSFLQRQGFDHESITSALKQSVPAVLWRRFETGE